MLLVRLALVDRTRIIIVDVYTTFLCTISLYCPTTSLRPWDSRILIDVPSDRFVSICPPGEELLLLDALTIL